MPLSDATYECLARGIARLRESEKNVDPHYLDGVQAAGALHSEHRERVVAFIFDLSEDFKCSSECGWLALNLFERYVSKKVSRDGPFAQARVEQVLHICFLLAAKFLERCHPSLSNIAEMSDCDVGCFQQLELELLETLGWDLRATTPHSCVELFLPACCDLSPAAAEKARRLALSLIDLSAFESSTREFTPLTMAAAACSVVLQKNFDVHAVPLLEACELERLQNCVSVFSAIYTDSVIHFEPIKPKPSDDRSTSPKSIMSLLVPGSDTPEPLSFPPLSESGGWLQRLNNAPLPNIPMPMVLEDTKKAVTGYKRSMSSSSLLEWASAFPC